MLIYNILLIVQIIVALSIIGLVLIQHGKGADAGAAFGGGSSGTVFGSQGSGNFLSRSTGILAAVFFANSLALAWLVAHRGDSTILSSEQSVVPQETTQAVRPAPVAEPKVPSDVPANIGNPETNAKPSTDKPAKVESTDVKTTPVVEKPAATGSQAPTEIPVVAKPPVKTETAPADVPQ
jgi:preprotein translocase subunit SecG